jgi:TRAP-type uncharacterized transport system substrate-binding protein
MNKTTLFRARSLAAALLTLSATGFTAAQDPSALRVASGPAGKVYELAVRDMQTVCGATVPLIAVGSSGGLQNLSLLSASAAEIGIVQVDTLRDMTGGDPTLSTLQALMPLHNNLLHVIALAQGSKVGVQTLFGAPVPLTGRTVVLHKFSELKGMTVAVVGSAQLMGQTLARQLGLDMKFVIADTDDHAVALLRAGTAQAIFTLGGWPLPSVDRHKVSSGLTLVDYDLTPQPPYVTVKRNYQGLDAFNINFLGVPNLLVTRPFKPGGSIGTQVATLQNCLRQHLDELQEGRYQSIWKEVKDVNASFGVPMFESAPGPVKSAKR